MSQESRDEIVQHSLEPSVQRLSAAIDQPQFPPEVHTNLRTSSRADGPQYTADNKNVNAALVRFHAPTAFNLIK
jgi:hypothetical protein